MYEEWKRIWSGWLPWLLLALCLVINGWILWNFSGNMPLAEAAGEIAAEGAIIVDESRAEEIGARMEGLEQELADIPSIRQMLDGAIEMAAQLTVEDLASAYCAKLELKEEAKEYAQAEFNRLAPVLEENRENGTANTFFVPCNQHFFELYSCWLLLACTIENIAASAILMMRLANDPIGSGTAGVIYATRAGRGIQNKKRRAGAAGSLLFSGLNLGLTLGAAAWLYPLGGLWEVRLGSMMLLDTWYPVISYFPMTVRQYVMLQAGISILAAIWFAQAADWMVLRTKSSLTAAAYLAFICALVYTAAELCPRHWKGYFALLCQPVELAKRAGHWMVSGGGFLSPEGYEAAVLLGWGLVLIIGIRRQMKRFGREDLLQS